MSEFEDGYNKAIFDMRERIKHKDLQGLKPSKFAVFQSIDELVGKVHEEIAEWVLALKEYKRKPTRNNRLHLLSEAVDVQFAEETFIAALEPVAEGRDAVRKDVAYGNTYVGYYHDVYGSQEGAEKLYRLYCGNRLVGSFTTRASMDAEIAELTAECDDDKKKYTFKVYKLEESGTAYDGECGF